MIYSIFLKLLLVTFIINTNTVKCDYDKMCHEKCLANSALRNSYNNIDIYLEYKKAIIKVPVPPKIPTNKVITLPNGETLPGMLNYEMKRPKVFWKRGINARVNEVNLRQFVVVPVEGNNEGCSSINLNKTRKKINCRPRQFVVDVISTSGKVYPNKVLTKQCSGYCNENTICTAVKSKNISVSVQVLLEDGRSQCSTILVPQDTKCKCQCATTAKECNSNQKFNKKMCVCECTNENEKNHCQRKIKQSPNLHFWDDKICSCSCIRKPLCSTGATWDEKRCRCSTKTDNG